MHFTMRHHSACSWLFTAGISVLASTPGAREPPAYERLLLRKPVCGTIKGSSVLVASTERWGEAGPVTLLLGSENSPADLIPWLTYRLPCIRRSAQEV